MVGLVVTNSYLDTMVTMVQLVPCNIPSSPASWKLLRHHIKPGHGQHVHEPLGEEGGMAIKIR